MNWQIYFIRIIVSCWMATVAMGLPKMNLYAQTATDTTQAAAGDTIAAQNDTAKADPMAEMFEKKCYSCHNIGGGDKKGPDLQGVTQRRSMDWLINFIQSPASLRTKGDPTTLELFDKYAPEVMPDQDLSATEIISMMNWIADLTQKNKTFVPQAGKLVRQPLPQDVPIGRKLFTGEMRFQDGGAACIACHSVNGVGVLGGGTLGPDLTKAAVKFSDAELVNILQNPNFPNMVLTFQNHKFTDEELVRLVALLQAAQEREPTPDATKFRVVGLATLGVILFLILMNAIWKKRLRGVRKNLVGR